MNSLGTNHEPCHHDGVQCQVALLGVRIDHDSGFEYARKLRGRADLSEQYG